MENKIKSSFKYLMLMIISYFILNTSTNPYYFILPFLLAFVYALINQFYPLLIIPSLLYYLLNTHYYFFISIIIAIFFCIAFYKLLIKSRYYNLLFFLLLIPLLIYTHNYLNQYAISRNVMILQMLFLLGLYSNFNYCIHFFNYNKYCVIKLTNSNYFIILLSVLVNLNFYVHSFPEEYFFCSLILTIIYLAHFKNFIFAQIYAFIGLVLFLVIQNNQMGLIFPLIALLYYHNHIINSIILCSFFIIDIYFLQVLPKNYSFIMLNILIIWELFKNFFLPRKENQNSDLNNDLANYLYDEVTTFLNFLTDFKATFLNDQDQILKSNEVFNYLIQNNCIKCSNKYTCYGDNKVYTYQYLKDCLKYGEEIHKVKFQLETLDYIQNCFYSKDIISKADALIKHYNINNKEQINDRNLAKQIDGLSMTLTNYLIDLSNDRDEFLIKLRLFKITLENHGFKVVQYKIKKYFTKDYLLHISLVKSSLLEVSTIIRHLFDNFLNTKCQIQVIGDENQIITALIKPQTNYKVSYGQASLAKEDYNIAGDNYLIKNLDDGRFIGAISDGMGSGYKAYNESKITLKLLDHITNTNVNTNTSLNLLNTFYSLKDNNDYYATLDLAEINLQTGKVNIFKMGGTNTYIVQDSQIQTIFNSNLPFGVNDLVIQQEYQLKEDDLVILVSDGISENISSEEFTNLITNLKHKKAENIVYDVLNKILEKNNQEISDDMSIIVLKLEKNLC